MVSATRQAVKASLDTSIAALGATEIVKAAKWKAGEALETWQQAKYEKLEAEWKLLPRERLDIDMYSPEQLNGLKKRLWLAESAAKEEVEKAYRLRLYEAMEQYENLGKRNLERMGKRKLCRDWKLILNFARGIMTRVAIRWWLTGFDLILARLMQ